MLWAVPQAGARPGQDPAPEPGVEEAPGGVDPGGQAPAQVPAGPEAPTAPAESDAPDATTTTVEVLGPNAASEKETESDRAGRRVRWVVIALLVLAVVVSVVTVVFWRRTTPARVTAAEADAVVSRAGKP